jgi:hypothetical protein
MRGWSRETYLDTRNPDSDMSSLDHRNVVRSVSDSEKNGGRIRLDELDDERFLKGRNSTADHSLSRRREKRKGQLAVQTQRHEGDVEKRYLAHQRELKEDLGDFLFESERQTLAVYREQGVDRSQLPCPAASL